MSASTRQARVTRAGIVESERGSVIVLTAVMVAMLLGVTAFALDASFMYTERNRLYAAADAGAMSAAFAWRRWGASADLNAYAASAVAGTNLGYTPTIVVHHCDDGGALCTMGYTPAHDFIEVTVSKNMTTFLGGILGIASMTPSARAVAGTSDGANCLITANGISIGNSQIQMPQCGVAAGGNINGGNPNAVINANPTATSGTCTGNCGGMANLQTGVPTPADPLIALPTPAIGSCGVPFSGLPTWTPGCYSSVTLNGVVTMAPGDYFVTGLLSMSNDTSLTGSDVFLYLGPSASTNFGNRNNLTLAAQTSGPYAGIAFFQDRSNNHAFLLPNDSGLDITGAFYAIGADVDAGNHLGNSGDCSVMIVTSLTIGNGNGHLENSCTGFGGSVLKTTALAE